MKNSLLRTILLGALGVSLFLNVALARRLAETRATAQELQHLVGNAKGRHVTSLSGERLGGEPFQFAPDGSQKTLLYVFRPGCGWCRRNEDAIEALVKATAGTYRVIGVSLDREDLEETLGRAKYSFPIVTGLSEEDKALCGMGETPQTLVLGENGVILGDWRGAYVGDTRDAVASYFGVDLPMVREGGNP